MRLGNQGGRLVIVTGDEVVDVATASEGRFGPDPQSAYEAWDGFTAWAAQGPTPTGKLDEAALGPVSPRPRQIFAVGLNYADHAAESGHPLPQHPMIFTKFVTSLTGPFGDIVLPSATVDWEVELVAVIGRAATGVRQEDAWSHVAGLTIGQDISEREVQRRGQPPQFSLAKSYPGFGPVGPWLVTLDEAGDPGDLALGCTVNGEVVQDGNTSSMIFSIPELIAYLSGVCTLLPGDLIFTGTPPGVGMGRKPPRYLAPGDVLETTIEGLGTMRHRLISPSQ
ncbi:fumarylacetoacetate hydrolase family protein [Phytohabitans sp. ZYX-F-186]|uniref:Fumarylacetoacetate hydrolase family protein n=1 Tax=Phytohabitans maris TaxID=3071409 RepID=A0ABU0ZS37_9ACTN|nr:fumarylacetoacetate hydrolase family protein [Phytohabitans sp. ZYX-F-186]MDQ7909836.1 fumarylacetoacetate hydrolase family protein [Phytohabitans sp. ZYX-F-186]